MAEVLEFDEMFYTAFEPKSKNRFTMSIDGIPSYIIKAAGSPKISLTPIVIDHINVQRKLKGKAEWEDIQITLYDPVVPSGAQAVMEWIRLSHESVTGRDGYSDFYKKDIDLHQLGPVGDKVGHWRLKGAFVSAADFGDWDWSTGDPQEISVTITYDYAVLEF